MQRDRLILHSRFRDVFGFHLQDAKSGLETLAERVSPEPQWPGLSTTITSPPYYRLKDYGAKGQIGSDRTYPEYLDDLTDVFRLVHSLTSENGSFWLVCNSFNENGEVKLLPFDLAEKMKAIGWKLKEVVIWEKDRNLPWSTGRFRNVFEYVLLFAKREMKLRIDAVRDFNINNFRNWWVRYPERYSPNGIAPTDLWKISLPVQGSWRHAKNSHYHLCPFPVELVRRMLLLTTAPGDIVLDPFAGSGVVLATADYMGRPAIGFEIKRQYVDQYLDTIKNEVKVEVDRLQETKSETQDFSNTLIRLRLVKLPRILARSLNSRRSPSPLVRCVLAIERRPSRDASVYALRGEDVFLVVGQTSREKVKNLESAARETLGVPPLSKYGIEVKVEAILPKQLRSILRRYGKPTMWLYKGRNYAYTKTVKLAKSPKHLYGELTKSQNKLSVPLLSDVRVDIHSPISMSGEDSRNLRLSG